MSSDLPENPAEPSSRELAYESVPLPKSGNRKLDGPLTGGDAAMVVIRLIALYEGLLGLTSIFGFILQHWARFGDLGSIDLQDLIPIVIYVSVFVVLWLGAWPLSAWICRVKPAPVDASPDVGELQRTDLLAIGVALMGIWMLAFWAIPSLTQDLVTIVGTVHLRGADAISQSDVAVIVLQGVRVIVGLYLIKRSRRIAARWAKLPADPPSPEQRPL